MRQYLDLMQNVLDNGTWQENRTGIRTKMIPAAMLQFDLRKGFPAVTTKRLAYRSVVGELLCFLMGATNAFDFEAEGSPVWLANASSPEWLKRKEALFGAGDDEENLPGYLGPIYGAQWRDFNGDGHDQLQYLIQDILENPTSRRLLVTAWNPLQLHEMALPPCHYSFLVTIEQATKTMHLRWDQRSCDLFLGIPFNIASYATLLHILAAMTGYTPGILTGMLSDVHLYENHLDQVQEQLSREPFELPTLDISNALEGLTGSIGRLKDTEFLFINNVAEDFKLVNYQHHPAIKAPMAV